MRSIQFRAAFGGQRDGGDRRAAGRQFVDGRDVEVGIRAHRQRARDRRGGHHQLVRHRVGWPLVAQGQALVHAEAVLFVDDGQREAWKATPSASGMGTDDDLRFARHFVQRARPAGDLAGQPAHAHVEAAPARPSSY